MGDEIRAPRELMEQMAALRFPANTDARMQDLMDRNNERQLSPNERAELESLVDMSETMSLLKMQALVYLGRKP